MDGPVTVASFMGGLTASRDKATSFSKAPADLQKKGLDPKLLQQIAEAISRAVGCRRRVRY
ncbi:hypothetical protein [Streptomyces afghaniensis]|uniref:hypothetical protein n=1 Tax=Streptomyces afghaniensis TaxID=66865 RepID=UPI0037A9A456